MSAKTIPARKDKHIWVDMVVPETAQNRKLPKLTS